MPDDPSRDVEIARLQGRTGQLETGVADLKIAVSDIRAQNAQMAESQHQTQQDVAVMRQGVSHLEDSFREFSRDIKSFGVKVAAGVAVFVLLGVIVAAVLGNLRL